MEPEGSLPRLQVPATYTYFEPDQHSPCPLLPHFLKVHLSTILPSTPRFPKCTLSLVFPQLNPLCNSPVTRATCPTHLILLGLFPRIFDEEYRSLSSCSFRHSHLISHLLNPHILLSSPFSDTLSLRSSLNVSDQVSHPYKTTGKLIFLYRMSQEECGTLRESVPYVKLYRYNSKHLCPK